MRAISSTSAPCTAPCPELALARRCTAQRTVSRAGGSACCRLPQALSHMVVMPAATVKRRAAGTGRNASAMLRFLKACSPAAGWCVLRRAVERPAPVCTCHEHVRALAFECTAKGRGWEPESRCVSVAAAAVEHAKKTTRCVTDLIWHGCKQILLHAPPALLRGHFPTRRMHVPVAPS